MIQEFVDRTFSEMTSNENYRDKIIEKLTEKFDKLSEVYSTTERWNTACGIIAKKIVYNNLALRKKLVGELLKTTVYLEFFAACIFHG